VQRQTEAGYDDCECPLPAVVTVTAGVVEPRYPSFKGIMQAKSKPVDSVSAADLELDASQVGWVGARQEIVSVAAAETEDPEHSVGKAIRTVVWRILVFYIGSVFVIATVLPATSESLASPFAGVLDAAGIPGAATAITLVAVVALLSALNANLYGASRMVYSLAERAEAPQFLTRLSGASVPMLAVGVSVAFGFVATVLELLFPERILPALFQLVGSTCLVVWGSALVSQLILRRRADREGTPLPLRMKGFPALTIVGLVLLGLIFAVGFSAESSRLQLFSTIGLIAGIAMACAAAARFTARTRQVE